jgi:invasion protein IalB
MRLLFVVFFTLIFLIPPAAAEDSAWGTRCEKDKRGQPTACEMYQRLVDVQTGMRVAEFAIGIHGEDGAARGVIILPLGILLQPGVLMSIDNQETFKFAVRYCTAQGCYAYVDLNDQLLALMQANGNAVFRFQTHQGEMIEMPMTLMGFTKAYDAIR